MLLSSSRLGLSGDKYYQCVLASTHRTESLTSLHDALVRGFGHQPEDEEPRYFPHLSLVYGDLTIERKNNIISHCLARGIAHQKENEVGVNGVVGFKASQILLVTTKGPTATWTVLGKVDLE